MGDAPLSNDAWPAVSVAEARARLLQPGGPFEIEEAVIGGRLIRVWKDLPPTLRDEVALARAFGAKPFLIHEEERADFEGFWRACAAFARRLEADGVQPGDRVAIAMRNFPQWPVAFYGATMAGAVAAALNGWWSAEELAFGLNDCGAKAAVFDGERWERLGALRGDCPDLALVYGLRCQEPFEGVHLEELLGAPGDWSRLPDEPPPAVAIHPDDDAAIFYTSGTSGRPKGAVTTHRAITTIAKTTAFSLAFARLREGRTLVPPAPGDPQKGFMAGLPFFHVTGLSAMLQGALHNGRKLVMMRRWDPARALQLIEQERLTNLVGVPTQAWQLVHEPGLREHDLSSLEMISYGASPASPAMPRVIADAVPGLQSGFGWGMTETCATFAIHYGRDYLERPTSSGLAPPVNEMRTVDEDGRVLAHGERGELQVRGPTVVQRYWNNPDASLDSHTPDGWLRTGDIAEIDPEGFLYIVDRAKDVIIRGGENIYSIEVESVLMEHPSVAEAAVVPVPHAILGEEPAAVVVLIPGAAADEADMKAHVAAHVAAFKVPVRILFSSEPLPRNGNGKVVKPELKAMLAAAAPSPA